ncbi:MAG: major facilitator superfamily domain-containing protein 6 [Caldilineaceae bacterium]
MQEQAHRPSMVIPRLFYFCYFAAMAALAPFLALHYRQIGLSEGQIGILAGLPPLLGLVAAPLWGGLADATQQHKRLLSLAVIGAAGAVALLSQVTALIWLLPVVALYALCSAPIIPLVDNSVLLLLGERKAEYGKQRLWGAVGWGLSATVLGALIERTGLGWAFVGALLLLGGCLYAAQRLAVQPVSLGQPFWQGMRFFATRWPWIVFLITLFLNGMAAGVGNNFLFLYLDQLQATKTLMGVSLLVATISEVPIFFFGDRLLQRWGARGLLLFALGANGLRMFGYALMPAAWFVLPIHLLHGLTFSALWMAGVSYANRAAPPGMGATAQGLLSGISMGLAGAAGALLGGQLYESVGPAAMFGWSGVVVLIGLLFFAVAGRRARDLQQVMSTTRQSCAPASHPEQ